MEYKFKKNSVKFFYYIALRLRNFGIIHYHKILNFFDRVEKEPLKMIKKSSQKMCIFILFYDKIQFDSIIINCFIHL